MAKFVPAGQSLAQGAGLFLKKNTTQLNATDNLQLGAAPPTNAAVNIDGSSFSGQGVRLLNGTADLRLVAGDPSRGTGLGTYSNDALSFWVNTSQDAWQMRSAAGIASLVSQQAATRLIPGASGFSFRDNANTTDEVTIDVSGNVVAQGNSYVGSSRQFGFVSRSGWTSPADGNIALFNNAGTTFGLLQFGGTSSAFPAWKRQGTILRARLADDSADAPIFVGQATLTQAATSNGAGTITLGSTTQTTVGATGAASALPANPLGYMLMFVGTTQVAVPYYNH